MKKNSEIIYKYAFFLLISVISLAGCSSTQYQVHTGVSDLSFFSNGQTSSGIFIKPESGSNQISKGEAIQVTLQRAFVRDFREGDNNPGEIAVIAKVYEDDKIRDQSLGSIKDGRLVYYSEDVAKTGQTLNALGIPMYGPIIYNGNSLVMEFYIVEKDQEKSAELASILKVTAELGGKAYPPGSPYLDILGKLGSTILMSNKDDLEVEYKLVMQPNDGKKDLPKLLLQTGNYVLLRKLENREIPIDWEKIKLNENNGMLLKINEGDGQASTPFTEMSYIVIQVNTADPGRAKDTAEAQTLSEFQLKQEKTLTENINDLKNNLEGVDRVFEILSKKKEIDVIDATKKESNKITLLNSIELIFTELNKKEENRKYTSEQIELLLRSIQRKFPDKLAVLTKTNITAEDQSLTSLLVSLGIQ